VGGGQGIMEHTEVKRAFAETRGGAQGVEVS
jgi:hypothetical protein